MASVAPQEPGYRPKLPTVMLRGGQPSDAHPGTVTYAGETLAGPWTVNAHGAGGRQQGSPGGVWAAKFRDLPGGQNLRPLLSQPGDAQRHNLAAVQVALR